jgi:hypothetical protein
MRAASDAQVASWRITRAFPLVSLAAVVVPGVAFADFTRVTWQASIDNGQSWQAGGMEVSLSQETVRFRALFDWDHPTGYALHGCFMDVTVSGLDNVGAADEATGVVRPSPFGQSPQTIVTTRLGNLIKIDDESDTRPPGLGPRAIEIGQPPEFLGLPFTREHHVPVFEFTLRLDGSAGVRIVDHMYRIGGTQDSTPTLYTDPNGAWVRPPQALQDPFELVVTPAPAAACVLVLAPFFTRRRR